MREDVDAVCADCKLCERAKSPNNPLKAPLQPIIGGFPNEIVGIDIMGPLPQTKRGHRYILVMVDYFTKWATARPIAQADAKSVAQEFLAGWIADHGVPYRVHTDRGAQFEEYLLRELCHLLKIDRSRTTAYHPEGNGQVERTNRTLKSLLRMQLGRFEQNQWDAAIPTCLLAYRAAIHTSTGQTPAFMTYGREFRLPADIINEPLNWPSNTKKAGYAMQTREAIFRAHEAARTKLALTHKHQKDYYDKKAPTIQIKQEKLRWLVPRNAKERRRFPGPTLHYRSFVKRFLDTGKPLCTLQNKNCKFSWSGTML